MSCRHGKHHGKRGYSRRPAADAGIELRQLSGLHTRQDDGYLARKPARARVSFIVSGIWRHRGESCRLFDRKIYGAGGKIVMRRRFAPEDAVTPLDHVEIDLENAPLVEDRLEHQRDQRLLALAPVAPLAR